MLPGYEEYFAFDASDEGLHTPGPQSNWNESCLFHLVEADGGAAWLIRIGRRVNEKYAEVTVMELRSDGSTALFIKREPISGHSSWGVAGLDFTNLQPLKTWNAKFSGQVSEIERGEALSDPKQAFSSAKKVSCDFDLKFEDIVPVFGAYPGGGYAGGQRHYEGIHRCSGRVTIDGKQRIVTGFGFRDHSWGVRDWHQIEHWRWCFGQIDAENVFSIVAIQQEGPRHVYGVAVRNGKIHFVNNMTNESEYTTDGNFYLERIRMQCQLDGDIIDTRFKVKCRVPLRHKKGEMVLRIVENLADVEIDGVPAVGWIEVADRIVDGRPVGIAAGD